MSFGKRTPRPAAPTPDAEAAEPVRYAPAMKVQDKSGFDAGFIALAAGVVVLAGGGAWAAMGGLPAFGGKAAIAAPAVSSTKGMDREAIKAKLAAEAFPGEAAHAFMLALKTDFPSEHDALLDRLADLSLAGSERSAFILELHDWTERFSRSQHAAIGRTGAEGWSKTYAMTTAWIGVLESMAPGCTAAQLEAFAADKDAMAHAMAVGTTGYDGLIAAARTTVDLAAAGRSAAAVDPALQADDVRAMRTVLGPASDERLLAVAFIDRLGDGTNHNPLAAQPGLNMCTLARSGLKQLNMLPSKTKSKLMAAGDS